MPSENVTKQVARAASRLEELPPEQWSIYKRVMAAARERDSRFAVGGGFATMIYSGRWRETKDIDLFIMERDRDRMIKILSDAGLDDYYEREPYQRHWIYRSYKGDVIVDVIWAMANVRAVVDETWFEGPKVEAGGERFALVPPEETLWNKLYVLQRDRCDWPDALSLLYTIGPDLDWRRVVHRVGEDSGLLNGLLSVFEWVCPDRARELPSWLQNELSAAPHTDFHCGNDRANLLDSRPWFGPLRDDEPPAPERKR
ncbi:MAG: nucleotidyltransferase [Acidobacteriaceae bacterium]|nr:nucleotidyltransferase [Acidobacteriaceae bacterium]MBV9782105.1 nucleotidyltransferase [Acidobacteriaceae bacterium]